MKLSNEQDAIKQAVEAGYDFDILANDGIEPKLTHIRNEFETQATNLREGGYQMVRAVYQDKGGKEYGGWQRWDYVVKKAHRFLQDPAFWQALGKARRWPTELPHPSSSMVLEDWKYHAIRYFETKLSGGDTQTYWQTLP